MNYLHVAVIEDFEECLISASEEGLRHQVSEFLVSRQLTPPTDHEWNAFVLAKTEDAEPPKNPGVVGLISYYKVDARSEKAQILQKLGAMPQGN